jgi:hypothetical protein
MKVTRKDADLAVAIFSLTYCREIYVNPDLFSDTH